MNIDALIRPDRTRFITYCANLEQHQSTSHSEAGEIVLPFIVGAAAFVIRVRAWSSHPLFFAERRWDVLHNSRLWGWLSYRVIY